MSPTGIISLHAVDDVALISFSVFSLSYATAFILLFLYFSAAAGGQHGSFAMLLSIYAPMIYAAYSHTFSLLLFISFICYILITRFTPVVLMLSFLFRILRLPPATASCFISHLPLSSTL